MKKLLFILLLFTLSNNVLAQEIKWFQTTEVAYKLAGYEWSDWQSSRINIKLDITNLKITIYSNEVQIYRIIDEVEPPYDPNGAQLKYQVIDQDGDYGYLRFRMEKSTNSWQLYIDFNNVSWVYNIIKK